MTFREIPDSEIKKLYLSGMTRTVIADRYGVTEAQVRNRLENAGVYKRSRKKPLIEKEDLEKRLKRGATEKEIAQAVGCSESHLRRLRRRFGIAPKQPIKNKRPPGISKWRLTATQEEMLVGTLMGDSSIVPAGSGASWRFTCGHCEQQVAYLEHKREMLRPFSWDLRPQTKRMGGKVFKGFKLDTFAHREFGRFRDLFYPEGTKVFRGLAPLLTPRALAYWMMDDGGVSGKTLVVGYHNNEPELRGIRDHLEDTFGIDLRVRLQAPGFFKLAATTKKSRSLLAPLVEPFFHPSMRYKIARWLTDNPEPSLGGNPSEGATTRSSLTPQGYGGNDHLLGVIPSGSAAGPNDLVEGQDIVWTAQRCAEGGRNDRPQPLMEVE